MTREQIVRAVLRAYPPPVRQAHGDEMLSTLLDTSEGSTRLFIRELRELLRAGLRSRSRVTADIPLSRLLADGLCLAGILWMAISICTLLSFRSPHWQVWLLLTAVSFALVGYDRIAGVLVLAEITLVTTTQLHTLGVLPPSLMIAWHLGPGSFSLVMVLAPRRRPHHPRSLIWLAPLAAAAYASPLSPSARIITSVAFFAVSFAGLASLPTDPRLAIAAASVWTSIGIGNTLAMALAGGTVGSSPLWVALTAPGPIIVALATARIRYIRLNAPT